MRADEQISSSVFVVRLITLQTYKLNQLINAPSYEITSLEFIHLVTHELNI